MLRWDYTLRATEISVDSPIALWNDRRYHGANFRETTIISVIKFIYYSCPMVVYLYRIKPNRAKIQNFKSQEYCHWNMARCPFLSKFTCLKLWEVCGLQNAGTWKGLAFDPVTPTPRNESGRDNKLYIWNREARKKFTNDKLKILSNYENTNYSH